MAFRSTEMSNVVGSDQAERGSTPAFPIPLRQGSSCHTASPGKRPHSDIHALRL